MPALLVGAGVLGQGATGQAGDAAQLLELAAGLLLVAVQLLGAQGRQVTGGAQVAPAGLPVGDGRQLAVLGGVGPHQAVVEVVRRRDGVLLGGGSLGLQTVALGALQVEAALQAPGVEEPAQEVQAEAAVEAQVAGQFAGGPAFQGGVQLCLGNVAEAALQEAGEQAQLAVVGYVAQAEQLSVGEQAQLEALQVGSLEVAQAEAGGVQLGDQVRGSGRCR